MLNPGPSMTTVRNLIIQALLGLFALAMLGALALAQDPVCKSDLTPGERPFLNHPAVVEAATRILEVQGIAEAMDGAEFRALTADARRAMATGIILQLGLWFAPWGEDAARTRVAAAFSMTADEARRFISTFNERYLGTPAAMERFDEELVRFFEDNIITALPRWRRPGRLFSAVGRLPTVPMVPSDQEWLSWEFSAPEEVMARLHAMDDGELGDALSELGIPHLPEAVRDRMAARRDLFHALRNAEQSSGRAYIVLERLRGERALARAAFEERQRREQELSPWRRREANPVVPPGMDGAVMGFVAYGGDAFIGTVDRTLIYFGSIQTEDSHLTAAGTARLMTALNTLVRYCALSAAEIVQLRQLAARLAPGRTQHVTGLHRRLTAAFTPILMMFDEDRMGGGSMKLQADDLEYMLRRQDYPGALSAVAGDARTYAVYPELESMVGELSWTVDFAFDEASAVRQPPALREATESLRQAEEAYNQAERVAQEYDESVLRIQAQLHGGTSPRSEGAGPYRSRP